MIVSAGLLSFLAAFVLAWFTQKASPSQPADKLGVTDAVTTDMASLDLERVQKGKSAGTSDERVLTEKQLKSLIYDVREKMLGYNNKLDELELREQRLQVAQDVLKQDIEKLDSLRIDLASMVANLKEERDKLLKERIRINQAEKANFISVAATYDKMDPASASQILTNMSKITEQTSGQSNGLDEAVKILHYMTERTKAKVLAELVASEPKLAAAFCRQLKQVTEEN
jgi:flagellar motility protein MotE (MotC chaperone)